MDAAGTATDRETQRLQREVLGDLKATKDAKKPVADLVPTSRTATASDLADELEPGTSARPSRGKRKWPVIVLALVVLGGGAATGAMLLANKPKTYQQVTRIGVALTEGKRIDDLNLLVETNGKVTTDAVVAAYREALAQLQALDPKVVGTFNVVDTIVAIPSSKLCDASITHTPRGMNMTAKPCVENEPAVPALYGSKAGHLLVIADDPAALAASMRYGVARAVCDFQPFYLDDNSDADKVKHRSICELTERFAGAK